MDDYCDLSRYQDDIGQLAGLKTYTPLLLCFPILDRTSKNTIIQALDTAARKLTSAFPWLAAKVVHEGRAPGNSGVFKLAPCSEFSSPNSIVIVKDHYHDCPQYEDIKKARGPISLLNGKVLGPVIAFPETYEESESNPARVLAIQANFIEGGLLLVAAAQHNFIDGGGLFQCMRLFAKALRGEDFSDVEIRQGNRDRRKIIPLLGQDETLLNHSHLKRSAIDTTQSQTISVTPRASVAWHYFRVPAHKLAQIKDLANSGLDLEASKTPFVSSNDALSAFLWKRLSTVRLQRLQRSPDDYTKFSRAMDARRAMGVPKEYMGQMGYNVSCQITFGELDKLSLGSTAALLRNRLTEVNTEYSVRSWATFIAQELDKSTIMFGGTFNPDTDIGLSSLAHVELYSAAFGVLGKPDLVRRPNFSPLRGCVYFWSRTETGDIDVLMCLNGVEIEGLKEDEEWKNHTEYIG